jgi:glycosyltransferase involved in cell wall biosynthesis
MTFARLLKLLRLAPTQLGNLLGGLLAALWFDGVGHRRLRHNRQDHARPARVAMISYVPVAFDNRIRRCATELAEAGYQVVVVKPTDSGDPSDPIHWHDNISFVLAGRVGSASWLPWVYDRAIVRAATAAAPDVVHCHDANTCLMGMVVAARTGAAFVADFHEWFSENVINSRHGDIPMPPLRRWIIRWIERRCLLYAASVITVSSLLAKDIPEDFGIKRKVHVVRNMPVRSPSDEAAATDLRASLGLSVHSLIVLYQGNIARLRNLEPVVLALPQAPAAVLVLRGPGWDVEGERLRQVAKRIGVADRVFTLPPIAGKRVVAEAAAADVGLWSLQPLCKNFQYSLPNKVFEYIAAGIPLLVAGFPEPKRIVETYEVGLVFGTDDVASIAAAMNRLAGDRDLLNRLRTNVAHARKELFVSSDWSKLRSIYAEI